MSLLQLITRDQKAAELANIYRIADANNILAGSLKYPDKPVDEHITYDLGSRVNIEGKVINADLRAWQQGTKIEYSPGVSGIGAALKDKVKDAPGPIKGLFGAVERPKIILDEDDEILFLI